LQIEVVFWGKGVLRILGCCGAINLWTMNSSKRKILTIGLLIICVTTMHAQSGDGRLNRIWTLNSVEHLSGTGGIGDEMKQLDVRSDTELIFEGGGLSEKIPYKVIDQEIRLFDKDGNHLRQDIIWKIDILTDNELHLLFIAREDNQKLARLKYRAKG